MVKVGDKVPDDKLLDRDETTVEPSTLQSRRVLVYSYP